jgi:hypothetical protein
MLIKTAVARCRVDALDVLRIVKLLQQHITFVTLYYKVKYSVKTAQCGQIDRYSLCLVNEAALGPPNHSRVRTSRHLQQRIYTDRYHSIRDYPPFTTELLYITSISSSSIVTFFIHSFKSLAPSLLTHALLHFPLHLIPFQPSSVCPL